MAMERASPEPPRKKSLGARETREAPGIRPRTILLILVLVPASVSFGVWNCWVAGGAGAIDSLIGPAVAGLTILTALNAALRKWRPAWALSRAEIITTYGILIISIGITCSPWDWCASLTTVIAWPIWNAGPENQWEHLLWPNLPTWLIVGNRDALEGFFLGDATPYRTDILRAWARPILWWTAWTTALVWVSMCFNVIVRRRWSQEEQLPFPMTILPLQMTEPRAALFRSSLWWIGLVLSTAVVLLNMLSRLIPSLPGIPTGTEIGAYLSNNPPWDALRTPSLSWDPWQIGLSYLMPVDLAFSMIVFNLFWRAEYVASRALGWTTSAWSGFPYGDQQTIGGYIALMVSVLWLDRRYLIQVVRKACGLRSVADDREEAFSYRTAVLGALVGLGFLWYFLSRAGMTGAVASGWLLLYFVMAMTIGRIRAHLGPPNTELYGAMPPYALTEFPGTRAIGSRGVAMLSLLRPYTGEQRPNPAPAQLEALRMAERAPIDATRLAWILVAVVPLTMLCYFWASLHFGYHLGLGTARIDRSLVFVAREACSEADARLRTPAGPNWGGVQAVGVGFGGTVLLMAIKLQFPAWPLHPVAFPLAFCYPIDAMLPAMVIAWAAKSLLLRYGGLRAHRRALPFFLGLIVGSATMALIQSLVFRALGMSG